MTTHNVPARLQQLLDQPARSDKHQALADSMTHDATPLTVAKSHAQPDAIETLVAAGYRPVADMKTSVLRDEVHCEVWAKGGVSIEVAIRSGKWFGTATFEDGSAIALWPIRSGPVEHPRRIVVPSTGKLRKDIDIFEHAVLRRADALDTKPFEISSPEVVVALAEYSARQLMHDQSVAGAAWVEALMQWSDEQLRPSWVLFFFEAIVQLAILGGIGWATEQWGYLVAGIVLMLADIVVTARAKRRRRWFVFARWTFVGIVAAALLAFWLLVELLDVVKQLN